MFLLFSCILLQDTKGMIDVEKKIPSAETYVPPCPKTAPKESYFQDKESAKPTSTHQQRSHNRNVGIPIVAEETHQKDVCKNSFDQRTAVIKNVDLTSPIRSVQDFSGLKQRCAKIEDMPKMATLALCDHVVGVTVVEVVSPWMFWVQMRTKDQQMQDIADRLE